jgi:hypothetical protein
MRSAAGHAPSSATTAARARPARDRARTAGRLGDVSISTRPVGRARPTPLGPGGRPLRGLRVIPTLLVVGSLAANAAVLLSDRAPGLLRRLSVRIDAGGSRAAGVASRTNIPTDTDFAVHVLIWGVAAVLVGLAAWSWGSVLFGGTAVFASSVVLEAAQQSFSSTRTVQAADVAANALGVAAGLAAVTALALLWRAAAAVLRPPR